MLQISQGETFVTQTDTEVVPKLCKVVFARLHKLDMQVTFTQVRHRLLQRPSVDCRDCSCAQLMLQSMPMPRPCFCYSSCSDEKYIRDPVSDADVTHTCRW